MKFIVNHNTQVYHREDCSCVPQILKENMMETEIRPLYHRPCSKCRPGPEHDGLNESIRNAFIMEVQE